MLPPIIVTRTFQSYLPISVYAIYFKLFKDRLNSPSSETTSPKHPLPSASPPWVEVKAIITVGSRNATSERLPVLSITGPALERERGLTNCKL